MSGRRRVAVVVFCEAEGADDLDAGLVAAMALRHALSGGALGAVGFQTEPWPVEVGFTRRDGVDHTANVVRIVEAGMALGNGYLWARVTPKAYNEGGAS